MIVAQQRLCTCSYVGIAGCDASMCKTIKTRQGLLKRVMLIRLVVITSIVQTYKLRRGIGEVASARFSDRVMYLKCPALIVTNRFSGSGGISPQKPRPAQNAPQQILQINCRPTKNALKQLCVQGVSGGLLLELPSAFHQELANSCVVTRCFDQSQFNEPALWYSVTRVSKKFFSFDRSIVSLIHGNGFAEPY